MRSGSAIVVRSGFASRVCVSLSCDQESKQRSLPQAPGGLVPWTLRLRSGQAPVRSSRARAEWCEQSTHPPISSAGKAFPSVRDDICLSRGPDQHPLGGDTAALLVAAPAQSIPGQALPQGSITWATADGFNNHENNPVTSHPPKTTKSRYSKSEK